MSNSMVFGTLYLDGWHVTLSTAIQRRTEWDAHPLASFVAVPNVIGHPSRYRVSIVILLFDGALLYVYFCVHSRAEAVVSQHSVK